MNSPPVFIALFLIFFISTTSGFAPSNTLTVSSQRSIASSSTIPKTTAQLVFGGDEERKPLSRENEPKEFFSTNTDKMSDQEKIPLALAGLAFISLPFIAGLVALYSAK